MELITKSNFKHFINCLKQKQLRLLYKFLRTQRKEIALKEIPLIKEKRNKEALALMINEIVNANIKNPIFFNKFKKELFNLLIKSQLKEK